MQKILLLIVFFLTATSYSQRYEGYVKEQSGTHEPIKGAKLFFIAFGTHVYTDSAGYWEIENIPEGIHEIEVSAPGYESVVVAKQLSAGSVISFSLLKGHRELDKVIVSNNGVLQGESITTVESLDINDLNAIPSTNLGQSLSNIPGVTQAGIGAGVSKPVIRGLTGSSIVTYVNSLRIQNQQWGGDHGLPVTSLGIGRAEVIKGPASLLYGADALGGVLYFVDEPYAAKNSYALSVQSQVDANNLGTSSQAGFKWNKNALRFNVYGGYDNYADYQLPNGNYVSNSRYKQTAGKFSLGYNQKKWLINLRYNYYNGRIGLPGHTHDLNPDPTSFQTTKQNRKNNVPAQRIQNHFTALESVFFLGKGKLSVTLGNTNNNLKEHEEKFSVADIIMNLNNTLCNAKYKYRINERLAFIVGSQGMFQLNRNGKDAVEILIPDANTTDLGGYALLVFKEKEWSFQAGGRFDNRSVDALNDATNFAMDYQGVNYAAGFTRRGKNTTVRMNVSSGFRAPNTSELLSDGVHHGTFRYELGLPGLTTEKAVQVDASFGLHFDDLEVSINPFYTVLQDYIYLERIDSVIDAFQVYQYTQTDQAQRYGGEAAFHYHPHFAHWIHLESNISTVFAEDGAKNPVPFTPQTQLNTQLRFELKMKSKWQVTALMLQHVYYFLQDRVGTLETPTKAYSVVNAGISARVNQKHPLLISLGVRNMLNNTYINHLSGLKPLGLADPGYAIYFGLKYEFKQQLKTNKR